jgi:hypothetical protein
MEGGVPAPCSPPGGSSEIRRELVARYMLKCVKRGGFACWDYGRRYTRAVFAAPAAHLGFGGSWLRVKRGVCGFGHDDLRRCLH